MRMVDRIRLRHILGDTLQFTDGKLDFRPGAVQGEYDLEAGLAPLVGDTLQLEAGKLDVGPNVSQLRLTDVRRFVPNGVLTNDNIDDAIDAAIAWAQEHTTAFAQPGYVVTVPAGRWELQRPHVIEAFGDYRPAVSFIGAGSNETIFVVDSDEDCSSVFTFGSASYDGDGVILTNGGVYGYFAIHAKTSRNCRRHGVTIHASLQSYLIDCRVRSIGVDTDGDWEQGHAIRVLEGVQSGQGQNNQFLTIRDCNASFNQIGLFLGHNNGPIHIENSDFEGNAIANVVLNGCGGYWRGGAAQSGYGAEGGSMPYDARRMPGIVTGWEYTEGLSSGTGATCSVATDGVCTVTGLSDLAGSFAQEGSWLELISEGESANELKTRGVYKIINILSATSCTIAKGSNHEEQANLSWQMRRSYDNEFFSFQDLYDEGDDRPMFGLYQSAPGGGSRYFIRACTYRSSDSPIVDAQSCGFVNVFDCVHSRRLHLRQVVGCETDISYTDIQYDAGSYPGLICKDNPFPASGYTVYPQTYRDASGPKAARLVTACKELRAVEIWDARVASSFDLDGSDVDGWEGLINGTVLAPAQTAPGYLEANDGGNDFGTPCVAIGTGTSTAAEFLEGNIAAEDLPTHEYSPSMLIVFRLPDATATANRRIMLRNESTTSFYTIVALSDTEIAANKFAGRYQWNAFPGNTATMDLGNADTNPHVVVTSQTGSQRTGTTLDTNELVEGGAPFTEALPAINLWTQVGGFNNTSGALHVAFIAVFPHALTPAEHQRLIDLALNEWPTILNPPES